MEIPSPERFLDAVNSYQRTAVIKAALELDVFSVIGTRGARAEEVASRIGASVKGVRILCDFLCAEDLLEKDGGGYQNTKVAGTLLDRTSPLFIGGVTEFLLSPHITNAFDDVAGCVRRGGTQLSDRGTLAPDHPVWAKFARAMQPMFIPPAHEIAARYPLADGARVLDVAAGHGMFGIAFAALNPEVRVTAVDWPAVLEVAKRNADDFGVAQQIEFSAGDIFDIELTGLYEAVLLPNFLHHFDRQKNIELLRKIRQSMKAKAKVLIVEFVRDEVIAPPLEAVRFALVMLCTTPGGDSYTFEQYQAMLLEAGFSNPKREPLVGDVEALVVAEA